MVDARFLKLWRMAIDVQEGRVPEGLLAFQARRLFPENWPEADDE
jgi:hypothetical protein